MKKNAFSIQKLESRMVTYQNLVKVGVKENNEKFVVINEGEVSAGYLSFRAEMKKSLKEIVIRKSVYNKLIRVQQNLIQDFPNLSIFVTYGYRSLEIQTNSFLRELNKNEKYFEDPFDLYEEVHRYVAVPSVAGHPTGGAVDVIIINRRTGKAINFGSKQYDYSTKKCYVYYPTVSRKANENRQLLRKYMMCEGFAPFDGEWWHFSYGDREWAYYYGKSFAIYDQISSDKLKKSMILLNYD